MPRPTPVQLVSGSVTVIGSTLAMLLLSQADSGPGVVVIALAGLALGVMVAMAVAAPRVPRSARQKPATARRAAHLAGAASRTRVSEHSLRR